MRLFPLAALMLLLTGISFGQDWGEYMNRDERFVVAFPGQPAVKDIMFKSELDKNLPAKVFLAQSGPVRYSITVVNYKDADIQDVRGSVAWAAWQIRKRGGQIQHDGFNANDRIEGHQLHILNADNTRTLVGIFHYSRRLYILEATSPADYPPGADFQQSLVILDEEGKRVRYEIDDYGNRTTRVPGEAYVPGAE
jgi:hypothetical protein